MHICFITPEFVTEEKFDGGLSNYLYRTALSLIDFGHTVSVVVSSKYDASFIFNNINVYQVYIEHQDLNPLHQFYQSYLLNSKALEINNSRKIDIIQYASFKSTGICRINSIPSVVRISSIQTLIMENSGIELDSISRRACQLEIQAIKYADGVFGPCKKINEDIFELTGVIPDTIESPYHSDVYEYDLSIYESDLKNKRYLFFYGTISVLKGILVIAEILNHLFAKYDDLYFVFVGKDAGFKGEPMVDYIIRKANKYKDRVIIYDKMNHTYLFPIIKGSIAVILPSRIDNFPNTCIESMALNKIVIATRNTGFDQLIEDGENGFLIQKDNPQELINVINKVLVLSKENIQLIEGNAANRVKLLDPTIVVRKLLKYYELIINNFTRKQDNIIISSGLENILCISKGKMHGNATIEKRHNLFRKLANIFK